MDTDKTPIPPPINPTTDLSRLQKMFKIYRDYIMFEHDLQNHRSTWHLLMQAFLFGTLGVIGTWQIGKGMPAGLEVERKWLPYILSVAGGFLAAAALASIIASHLAIGALRERWETQSIIEFDSTFLERVPSMKGGGSDAAEFLGKIMSLAIPCIALVAWISVAFMYQADKARDKDSQDTTAVPYSRFIAVPASTHPDIALDTVTGAYCKTWDWQSQKPGDKQLVSSLKTCTEIYHAPLNDKH